MDKKKKTKDTEAAPIGLRVRFEVINTILKNPSSQVKIPSSQELAKKFNLSQRTVTRELKKLVDDGYIIGKQGIGTFANPEHLSKIRHLASKNIIGIACIDARLLFFGYTDWGLFSHVGLAMPPDIGHPRPITLSSNDPETTYSELKSLNLDGIVWIMPAPEMHGILQRLRRDGMPVVTIIRPVPQVPFIGVDTRKAGREIAAAFLEQQKKRIFWCVYNNFSHEIRRGAIEFMKENNVPVDDTLIAETTQECDQKLPLLLKQHQVDAIFVHEESTSSILEMMADCEVSSSEVSLAVEAVTIRRMPDFKGVVRQYPFAEIGEQTAEWIQVLLKQPSALENAEKLFNLEIKLLK